METDEVNEQNKAQTFTVIESNRHVSTGDTTLITLTDI